MRSSLLQGVALTCWALGCSGAAFAQVSASISGKIDDISGGAIDGAQVTVKTLETGAERSVTTNGEGHYDILSLSPGPQQITVSKQGFRTAVRDGVILKVGQEAVIDLRLEVGDLSQQVTVSEDAPIVNTTTASVSGVVSSREVRELPLNGRSFDNLITLNPGAISYGLKSPQTSTSNGNTFTVAGRRPSDNIVLLNGIEYTGSSQLAITPGGVSGDLLGIDAVREFNVQTDTYSAEYGKRAGGQVSVVTQSGTNSLHGSLYEFLRNNVLDARNFFDQGNVPPFRRNQFGAALGGPLKKDRLFVFGNYEGFRQVLALSSVSVVPDEQVRQGLIPNATTGVYAKPANLNTAMLKYFQMWPDPNGPELLSNGVASGTRLSYNNPRQRLYEDFGTTRMDYTVSERDSLSGSYTIDDGRGIVPQADPLFASGLLLRMQVASLQETHVFTPNMVHTLRVGFSRAAFNLPSMPLANFPSSLEFVTGSGPGGIVVNGGVTTSGNSGITAAGPNNAANVWNRRNLYTVSDNLQWNRGRHQISIGVWFQRVQDNENTASRTTGQATFASLATFLSGTVTTFQVVPAPNELGWRSLFGAWYAQDAWRVRPNLTIELGLRHEFTTGWNEVSGRAANYITDANGILQTTPLTGKSIYTENNAKKLFGPRAGLAWDIRGNGRTSIRAGYGIYYSLIDDLSFLLNSLPPANGAASFSSVSLPSIVPITPGVLPPPSCGPGVTGTCTTFAPQGLQPDAKTLAVSEWSLRLEQQLGANTALRIAYVGSHGVHGLINIDPNTIPAQICGNPAGCIAGGVGATSATVPQGAQYIPWGNGAAAVRPNRYVGAGFFWYAEGNSSYNALQTEVTHRLNNGLQFRGNFTWSRSLDINSAPTGAQGNNQAQMVMNRNDILRDWGPSALNAKFQSSISARYELPFGRGNQPVDKVIGGWQVNGIVTLLSGFPFTPQIGANRSGDGDTRNPDRPSLNPNFNGPIITGSPNQYYNPAAFILPTVGTWGNLGRGVFTGPGLAALDLSVFKNIPFNERLNLQFRSEFFNLLNRANFATPNQIVFSGTSFSPSAGLISSTVTTSRQIQFGLKLIF